MRQGDLNGALSRAIADATGAAFNAASADPAGGGSINRCLILSDRRRRFFVKLNRAERAEMFAAEAEGLAALAATGTVRVPAPVCHGAAAGEAYLVLEHLPLAAGGDAAGAALGRQLAAMHRQAGEHFGWHRDNTLGTTPQPNRESNDWPAFLRAQRLEHQLRLLNDAELSRLGARLFERLPELFAGYEPAPSLIHGDLWGGNWSALESGEPVIYDPACYYADREMEIAMTELFGGFPRSFYAGYNEVWPLDAGYERRKPMYLLYHVLNHANLFGGGYRDQAKGLMRALL